MEARFPAGFCLIADLWARNYASHMRGANIIAGISIALWAALAALGVSVIKDVAEQHAPGYPNLAQIIVYLGFPISVVAAISLCAVLVNRRRGSAGALGIIATLSLFLLLPLLLGYSGGV